MSVYCFAAVTWFIQIVSLATSVTIRKDLEFQLQPGYDDTEAVQFTSYRSGDLEPFAVFLSDLSQKTSPRDSQNVEDPDFDKEFLDVEKNAISVGKDGSCYSRNSRCKKAGAWAYYLVCSPRGQCGGDPEWKFLYYNCHYCRSAFPFDGDSRGSTCEDVKLNKPNISERETGGVVLIAEDNSQTRPKVIASISPTVMTLRSCLRGSRRHCRWACNNSYLTLCSVDYKCPPDVLADFEKSCYRSCRHYFER